MEFDANFSGKFLSNVGNSNEHCEVFTTENIAV